MFVSPGQKVNIELPLPSTPKGMQWPAEFVDGISDHLREQAQVFLNQWMTPQPKSMEILQARSLEVTWDKSGTFSLKVNTD